MKIKTLEGKEIELADSAIVLIAGPYPHDVGPHTYIYSSAPGVLITEEAPESLIGRMKVDHPLAKLTRPNQTSVWIRGAAVTGVRSPLPNEITTPGAVNAVLQIGSLHQAVREDPDTVRRVINAHGGNV